MFSACRSPRNIVATACCVGTPLSQQPAQRNGNDDTFGATTMLLVCCDSVLASAETKDFLLRKPCCSQMTPVAETEPSAWVGKYQSARVVYPLELTGMLSLAWPVLTPVTDD